MRHRLLAIGDIHLGRRPSRLPETLADAAAQLDPAAAWRRAVDAAIDLEADTVALAGDVVDDEKDFFEGYQELEAGVQRLAKAGINVVGVAGNHDVEVLPRLAERIPGFRLLGRGGAWQQLDLGGLTIWGWSFPARHFRQNPLEATSFPPPSGPTVGLLHGDLDAVESPYAPLRSADLVRAGLHAWLLGHVHVPSPLSLERPNGYLGSLSALDPSEHGPRGPWLLTFHEHGLEAIEQLPISPLRWERLPLDVTGVEDAKVALLDAVRALDQRVAELPHPPKAVGLRVRLTGRGRAARHLAALPKDGEEVLTGESGARFFVERVQSEVRPELDLELLARGAEPPGLLARRLLLLEAHPDDPARRALLREARARLEPRLGQTRWLGLVERALDEARLVTHLRHSGLRLLEAMLDQKTPQEDLA